jgi:hypothetical protein
MDDPAHVESIPFGAARYCYVPSAHKLYGVGNNWNHSVFIAWDTRGDTAIVTFNGPCQVSGMCLDRTGEYIYCAGYGTGRMLMIGVDADSIVADFSVPVNAAARDPLAMNRRTHRLYEAEYDWAWAGVIPVIHDSMLIAVEETPRAEVRAPNRGPTIIRGSLCLPQSPVAGREAPPALLDISGRRVLDLKPGVNDVRALSPGVYFVRQRSAAGGERSSVTKVVIAK